MVICKSVRLVNREDAQMRQCVGCAQLYAYMCCGVEGAIQAVLDMFNSNDYGVLVMDAQNSFN